MHPTDTPRLTGTQINYLLICPRKLWLFSHHIEMERESDQVALGQLALHQKSFLHRIFRGKNRSLWSRKSLQNRAKKVLLTDGSVY
jgi:CRISPR/Cas system-associated exonuclease Cas4 (RecB family)